MSSRPHRLAITPWPLLLSLLALGTGLAAQGDPPRGRPAASDSSELEGELRVPIVLEGFVLALDGAPAEAAVVVSSAGGEAVTDAAGNYRLELEVPLQAESVQVTAVGRTGANLVASASVTLSGTSTPRVPPLQLARGSSCSPSWLPTFGEQPGTDGSVIALATYDDGTGSALYVGGYFTHAGSVAGNRIARWDGSRWSELPGGMNDAVSALAVFDDGSGPALYAGGYFTLAGGVGASRVARWDGSSWSALGSGMNVGFGECRVDALIVYDDGSGPALYAGGRFDSAGGTAASSIARWKGSSWAALGSGTNGSVAALAVYDDGGGPALYAGGDFTTAGAVPANNIAKWDGTNWTALGSGTAGTLVDGVLALTVYDDGGGPALYAGGFFTSAGGVVANHVARWDGSSWSAPGDGTNLGVYGLAVYDDGSGPALHAAGPFTTAGGQAAIGIAKWNGVSWSALGDGAVQAVVMVVHDDGAGPALFVGGGFVGAGGLLANHVARWDGASWAALGSGLNDKVAALEAYDDGGGPALYAAGDGTRGLAKWDGRRWTALGSGFSNTNAVSDLVVYDDGGGPALYAGGFFSSAGGVAASHIAKWNGTQWTRLGSGTNDRVVALTVYDDGSGSALYAGGEFTSAGGVAANHIAKWDGSNWAALGSGISGSLTSTVRALAVYDDGSGSALYVGGNFLTAGGLSARCIAKWNGSSWAAIGQIFGSGPPYVYVAALAVYDDGGGPSLYAGGCFTSAGGVSVSNLAKWNGSSWSAIGSGIDGCVDALLRAGPALYIGGDFTSAGGAVASHIARWNGSSWAALGRGFSGPVHALADHDDGGGRALFAGGDFRTAYDSGDSYLAKWGCPDAVPPVLDCPASLTVLDRAFDGHEVVSFTVTASDALDPAPIVVCVPPSGSVFPLGTTVVTCTATDASGNSSTCLFPVIVQRKSRPR